MPRCFCIRVLSSHIKIQFHYKVCHSFTVFKMTNHSFKKKKSVTPKKTHLQGKKQSLAFSYSFGIKQNIKRIPGK